MMSREVLSCALLYLLSHLASTFHQASSLLPEDCMEFDIADFEAYLSTLDLQRVPTVETMVSGFRCPVTALPFGALKSDWSRLSLLADAQPPNSTLKLKLGRLFRLLVLAYYDMEERFESMRTRGSESPFNLESFSSARSSTADGSTVVHGAGGNLWSNFSTAESPATSGIGRTTTISMGSEDSTENRVVTSASIRSTGLQQRVTEKIERISPTTVLDAEDSTQAYSLTTPADLPTNIWTSAATDENVFTDRIIETGSGSNVANYTGTTVVNIEETDSTKVAQSFASASESQTRITSTTLRVPTYSETSEAEDTNGIATGPPTLPDRRETGTTRSQKTFNVDPGVSWKNEATFAADISTEGISRLKTTTEKDIPKESTVRPNETIGIVTTDSHEVDSTSSPTSRGAETAESIETSTPFTGENSFSLSSDSASQTTKKNGVVVSTPVFNVTGSTASTNDASGSSESFSGLSFGTETGSSTSSFDEKTTEDTGSDVSPDKDDDRWRSMSFLSTDFADRGKSTSGITVSTVATQSTSSKDRKNFNAVKSNVDRVESAKDREAPGKSFRVPPANSIFHVFKHDSISLDRLHGVSNKMKRPPVYLKAPRANGPWKYADVPQTAETTTSNRLKSLLERDDELRPFLRGAAKPRKRGSLNTDVEKNFRWFFNQGREDEVRSGGPVQRPRNINIQCNNKSREV